MKLFLIAACICLSMIVATPITPSVTNIAYQDYTPKNTVTLTFNNPGRELRYAFIKGTSSCPVVNEDNYASLLNTGSTFDLTVPDSINHGEQYYICWLFSVISENGPTKQGTVANMDTGITHNCNYYHVEVDHVLQTVIVSAPAKTDLQGKKIWLETSSTAPTDKPILITKKGYWDILPSTNSSSGVAAKRSISFSHELTYASLKIPPFYRTMNSAEMRVTLDDDLISNSLNPGLEQLVTRFGNFIEPVETLPSGIFSDGDGSYLVTTSKLLDVPSIPVTIPEEATRYLRRELRRNAAIIVMCEAQDGYLCILSPGPTVSKSHIQGECFQNSCTFYLSEPGQQIAAPYFTLVDPNSSYEIAEDASIDFSISYGVLDEKLLELDFRTVPRLSFVVNDAYHNYGQGYMEVASQDLPAGSSVTLSGLGFAESNGTAITCITLPESVVVHAGKKSQILYLNECTSSHNVGKMTFTSIEKAGGEIPDAVIEATPKESKTFTASMHTSTTETNFSVSSITAVPKNGSNAVQILLIMFGTSSLDYSKTNVKIYKGEKNDASVLAALSSNALTGGIVGDDNIALDIVALESGKYTVVVEYISTTDVIGVHAEEVTITVGTIEPATTVYPQAIKLDVAGSLDLTPQSEEDVTIFTADNVVVECSIVTVGSSNYMECILPAGENELFWKRHGAKVSIGTFTNYAGVNSVLIKRVDVGYSRDDKGSLDITMVKDVLVSGFFDHCKVALVDSASGECSSVSADKFKPLKENMVFTELSLDVTYNLCYRTPEDTPRNGIMHVLILPALPTVTAAVEGVVGHTYLTYTGTERFNPYAQKMMYYMGDRSLDCKPYFYFYEYIQGYSRMPYTIDTAPGKEFRVCYRFDKATDKYADLTLPEKFSFTLSKGASNGPQISINHNGVSENNVYFDMYYGEGTVGIDTGKIDIFDTDSTCENCIKKLFPAGVIDWSYEFPLKKFVGKNAEDFYVLFFGLEVSDFFRKDGKTLQEQLEAGNFVQNLHEIPDGEGYEVSDNAIITGDPNGVTMTDLAVPPLPSSLINFTDATTEITRTCTVPHGYMCKLTATSTDATLLQPTMYDDLRAIYTIPPNNNKTLGGLKMSFTNRARSNIPASIAPFFKISSYAKDSNGVPRLVNEFFVESYGEDYLVYVTVSPNGTTTVPFTMTVSRILTGLEQVVFTEFKAFVDGKENSDIKFNQEGMKMSGRICSDTGTFTYPLDTEMKLTGISVSPYRSDSPRMKLGTHTPKFQTFQVILPKTNKTGEETDGGDGGDGNTGGTPGKPGDNDGMSTGGVIALTFLIVVIVGAGACFGLVYFGVVDIPFVSKLMAKVHLKKKETVKAPKTVAKKDKDKVVPKKKLFRGKGKKDQVAEMA